MSGRDLLSKYLKPQWRAAALLAVLLLLGIGLTLVNPQIVRYFIDNAPGGKTDAGSLLAAAVVFLLAAFARQAVMVAGDYVGERIAWKSTNNLRADLALHCLRLDLPFHKEHAPGELIGRVDGDVSALANFLSRFSVQVAGNALLLSGALIVLFAEDWRIGAGVTVYAAAALLLLWRLQNVGVERWARYGLSEMELYSFLEERLLGTEDIRSSGAEGYILTRLRGLGQALLLKFRTARLVSNITFIATRGLHTLGYALGLGLGAWLYTQGQITLGAAYMVVYYIALLAGPLDEIRRQVQDMQQASASIGRVTALFALRPAVRDPVGSSPRLPAGPLSVDIAQASFRYDESNLALDDVSIRIRPGEIVGVLGRTGSGKSTLTRLLFRLYDVSAGAIRLGNFDIREVGLGDLRNRIALVTQDVQLFQASIRDNLTLFNPRIGDVQIEAALRTLGLWEWVLSRPGGLDGKLAPGGQGQSAGEGQLLAFARAFLKDPGLVVLDEASSRLDPGTEQLLDRAVSQLLRGRTGIIIAHRLSTVQRADAIVIFEHGRVVEQGPRAELARDPGSHLYQLLQTGLDQVLEAEQPLGETLAAEPEEASHEYLAI